MSFDGRAVANYVLDLCEADGRPITHLSLQKIVFFCHVWTLAEFKEPLIKHQFEAWQFGPVLQYLYRDFREFDREPITSRATKLNAVSGVKEVVSYDFDVKTEELLKKVVKFYSRLSAGTLVALSHVENGPWHSSWNYHDQVNPGMKIDDEMISEYYGRLQAPF